MSKIRYKFHSSRSVVLGQVWSLGMEFLVNDVESKTISSTFHLGDQVSQLLDGLDLLLQVVSLDVVGQLSITMFSSNLVQIQQ